jgi:hypothetical protein
MFCFTSALVVSTAKGHKVSVLFLNQSVSTSVLWYLDEEHEGYTLHALNQLLGRIGASPPFFLPPCHGLLPVHK